MMVLITYDVKVVESGGRKRLRKISETCLNYGIRVQNSVFECEISPAEWVSLKDKLLSIYNKNEDSLRFYQLGSNWKRKVEHFGAKTTPDLLRDTLII